MAKMWWKRKKTLAAINNKKQWQREFDPTETSATEIQLEDGNYLVRESSISATPTYIIAE
jgi:hypothetical protein